MLNITQNISLILNVQCFLHSFSPSREIAGTAIIVNERF